jgi:ParB family chromosome partitioning protein
MTVYLPTDNLPISFVLVEERIRKDHGDLDELANSIRAIGLIHPVVITRDYKLIAGERRLKAMKKLGIPELIHAKTFIFNDEVDPLKLKAMEIEENVKRKQLSWQEELLAKKRLLDLLQQIHGVSGPGRPTRSEALGIASPGFGINKLASLLGESNATTSKDLELAALIEQIPQLAKAETKEAARRQVLLGTTVAVALQQAKLNPPKTDKKWELYEGDFFTNINTIPRESIDLVITDPPYGASTSGMGPNSKGLLATPFVDDKFAVANLLSQLAGASYHVLKQDRFAAFFFDFLNYGVLLQALRDFHFDPIVTPLIWVKNTVVNTDPYRRYGRSYEPILLAKKGEPKLMRPAQRDVIEVQNLITRGVQETKFYHAQKPVELLEKLIIDLCVPSGTVVDFCAGSGSTAVAAINQQRRAILFEKDAAACQIIKSRLGAMP